MVKIALDAGHGMNTPGKRTPDGEREWSFNNKVLLACEAKLNTFQNVQILRLDDPTGKTDTPLAARTNQANRWGADVLVSIHHNALAGKWGSHGGVETYTNDRPGANPKSVEIAKVIHPLIVKSMGLRDRGLKKKNLHMLRESNMPAVLPEGGFMDSTTDVGSLRSGARLKAQGEAIAEGLATYYKLVPKVVASVPSPPKEAIRMFKPKRKIFKDETQDLFRLAREEGIFSSDDHEKKVAKGEMPLDDAIGAIATIVKRVHFDKK